MEQGEKPLVLDLAPRLDSLAQVVDLDRIELKVGDILDYESLSELVRQRGIKKIVHAAANPRLVAGADEDPDRAIRLNIIGTANVLEVARKYDVERVMFSSSSTLYRFRKDGREGGMLKEDNYPRTTKVYTTTKLACENLGLNYFETYGVGFVALRFAPVFGPWSARAEVLLARCSGK